MAAKISYPVEGYGQEKIWNNIDFLFFVVLMGDGPGVVFLFKKMMRLYSLTV